MRLKKFLIVLLSFVSILSFATEKVIVGAERVDQYLHLLRGKRVGIVANHTSMIQKSHLVDSLLSLGIDIKYIFAPEHGFRGDASEGENIKDGIDTKTGVKIISLHGNTKAPSQEILKELDILVFDIQDVGLRFYTYLSTLHYTMSEAAKASKKVIVLDRPNPNGFYTDGPILNLKHRSFVGIYPIPVVHGMTLGELSRMANGEKWLEGGNKCDLTVIELENYTHNTLYEVPIAPSPNLPNNRAIYLYPNLCLFEATEVSIGRGTDFPFQVYGHPRLKSLSFSFTPKERASASNTPQKGKLCYGVDLRTVSKQELLSGKFSLKYLIDAYKNLGGGETFFTPFLEKLIGVDYVREMIYSGKSDEQIAKMWQEDVTTFKQQRSKYLIYK